MLNEDYNNDTQTEHSFIPTLSDPFFMEQLCET